VGGPTLGAQAITAELVDEYPPSRVRLQLELLDARWFGNGVGYLRYRTQT
jgi:hypothetical protein